MERWIIVLLFVFKFSHLIFQESQAQELINYPECVQDSERSALIGVRKYDSGNTASNCASYCKEIQNIFSGTKNTLCICGDKLTIGTRISTTCKTKCPGNTNETCGGEYSVSLRRTGYVKSTANPTRPETSSEINVSPKTDSNTSPEKGYQMTAVFIALLAVVIVAGSVVLIVYLVLRHRRREGNVNLHASRSSSCESDSHRNEILENHNYWILDIEHTTQTIQAEDSCYAECSEYCTILDFGETFDNKDYDKVNGKQATRTNTRAIYSHLPISNKTDNTYSHIGPASGKCMSKTDDTYNTVQFSQLAENSCQSQTNE